MGEDSTAHTIPEQRDACVCGSRHVHWTPRNGQRVAYCDDCGRFVYCVPGHETGQAPRKPRSSSPETVDATQRFRLMQRDRGACTLCGADGVPLEAGHLVSLAEGRRCPSLKEALGSDANLAMMCRPCNAELGSQSVPLLWMVTLHLQWARDRTQV